MIITQCPDCRDQISIPEGLPANAELRCPLCESRFEFKRLIKLLPPAAIVMNNDGGDSTTIASSGPGAGSFSINVDSDANPGDDVGFAIEGSSPTSQVAKPHSGTSSARRAGGKTAKNPVFEGLKIVLGGLLAFPLVQLGVWWLSGKDPLSLGPSVANYAPFVVPADLRGDEPETISVEPSELNDGAKNVKTDDTHAEETKSTSGGEQQRTTESQRVAEDATTDARPDKMQKTEPDSFDEDLELDDSDMDRSDRDNEMLDDSIFDDPAFKEPIPDDADLPTFDQFDKDSSTKPAPTVFPPRVLPEIAELIEEKERASLTAMPTLSVDIAGLPDPELSFTEEEVNETIARLIRHRVASPLENANNGSSEQGYGEGYLLLEELAQRVVGITGSEISRSNALASAAEIIERFPPTDLEQISRSGKKRWNDAKSSASDPNDSEQSNRRAGDAVAVCGSLIAIASGEEAIQATVSWLHESDGPIPGKDSEVSVYTSDRSIAMIPVDTRVIALGRIVDGQQIDLAPGPVVVASIVAALD